MNERIKTLRRLAIDELNQHFFSCPDNWDELVQDKIAELIVRECAALALFAEQYNMGDGKPISKQIIEHFGVEE